MALGIPLTDKDRLPWLSALATRTREAKLAGKGLVIACSALKRSYRDILRAEAPELRFIYLKGDRALVATRLAGRRGHFMPASLLDSQFATLEEPSPEENAWVCDISRASQDIVNDLVARATT
jgi:gluconokinase